MLASLWTMFDDRAAIASAADTIDRLLEQDPHSQGESRYGSRRVMFVEPLGVNYEVHEMDKLVRVLRVWRSRKPKSN
jgi:hypothetical protein